MLVERDHADRRDERTGAEERRDRPERTGEPLTSREAADVLAHRSERDNTSAVVGTVTRGSKEPARAGQ